MAASGETMLDVPFDLVQEACGSVTAEGSEPDALSGERVDEEGGNSANIRENPEEINLVGMEDGGRSSAGAQPFPPGEAEDAAVEEGICGNEGMSADFKHKGFDPDVGPNDGAQQHGEYGLASSQGTAVSNESKEMDEVSSGEKKTNEGEVHVSDGGSTLTPLSAAERTGSQVGVIDSTQTGSTTQTDDSGGDVLQSSLAPTTITSAVRPQQPQTDVPDYSSRAGFSSPAFTESDDPSSLSSTNTDEPRTPVNDDTNRDVSMVGNAGVLVLGLDAGGGSDPSKPAVVELAASSMGTGQAVSPFDEGGTNGTDSDPASLANDALKQARDAADGRNSSMSISSKSSERSASTISADPDSAAAGTSGEDDPLHPQQPPLSENDDQPIESLPRDALQKESPDQGIRAVVEEGNLVSSVPSTSVESRKGGSATTETANNENAHSPLDEVVIPHDEDDDGLNYDLDSDFRDDNDDGDLSAAAAADLKTTEAGHKNSRHSVSKEEDDIGSPPLADVLPSEANYDLYSDFGNDSGDGTLPVVAADLSSCSRASRVGTEAGDDNRGHIVGEGEDDVGFPAPAEDLPSKVDFGIDDNCGDDSGGVDLLLPAAGPSSSAIVPNFGTKEGDENSGSVGDKDGEDAGVHVPAESLHSNFVDVEPEIANTTVGDDSDYPADIDKVDEKDGNNQNSSSGSTLYDDDYDDDGQSHSSGSTLGASGRSSSGNSTEGKENSSNSSAGGSRSAGGSSSGSKSDNLSVSDSSNDGESARDGSTTSLQAPQPPPGVKKVSPLPARGDAADAASDQDDDTDDYSLGSGKESANSSSSEQTSSAVESTEAAAQIGRRESSSENGPRTIHDDDGVDPHVVLAPEASATSLPGQTGVDCAETPSEAINAAAERESQSEAPPATSSKDPTSSTVVTGAGDGAWNTRPEDALDTRSGGSTATDFNETNPHGSETVEPVAAGEEVTYKPDLDEIDTSTNIRDHQNQFNLMLTSALSSPPDASAAGEPHSAPPEASMYNLRAEDSEDPKLPSHPLTNEHFGENHSSTVAKVGCLPIYSPQNNLPPVDRTSIVIIRRQIMRNRMAVSTRCPGGVSAVAISVEMSATILFAALNLKQAPFPGQTIGPLDTIPFHFFRPSSPK